MFFSITNQVPDDAATGKQWWNNKNGQRNVGNYRGQYGKEELQNGVWHSFISFFDDKQFFVRRRNFGRGATAPPHGTNWTNGADEKRSKYPIRNFAGIPKYDNWKNKKRNIGQRLTKTCKKALGLESCWLLRRVKFIGDEGTIRLHCCIIANIQYP